MCVRVPEPSAPSGLPAGPRRAASCEIRASRTTTLCVFVSAIGEVSNPDSRTHSNPVSSPFPFSRWQPANNGWLQIWSAMTTVMPVRTDRGPQ